MLRLSLHDKVKLGKNNHHENHLEMMDMKNVLRLGTVPLLEMDGAEPRSNTNLD